MPKRRPTPAIASAPRARAPHPSLDSMLADDLRPLEVAARAMGGDILADVVRAAVALAEDGDQGTLARIGGVLGAAALMFQRGGDPAFDLLHQISHAIVHRLGIAPRRALRRFMVDELIAALGRKTAELEARGCPSARRRAASCPSRSCSGTEACRMVGRRARVLVIDDDALLGALVAKMLRREHDVAVATSAGEALEGIGAGERFDLILCDLMMPGATGVDFHERLAPLAPEQLAGVVYMTGGAFSTRSKEFLAQASIRWIEKPFGVEELRRLVLQHAP